jgi:ABC-type branched-subunit amino acid transport system ATPase component
MVAIGRALVSKPRLMILVEPSKGLAPLLVGKVLQAVEKCASRAPHHGLCRLGILLTRDRTALYDFNY